MRQAWVVVVLAARTAAADHVSVHATAVGSVAATDNVFSVQDGQPTDGDVFVQVRPGVLFTWETPRMLQEVAGSVEVLEFLRHNDQPSYSYAAGLRSFYVTSPRSDVLTTFDASSGQVSALTTRSAPDTTGVALLPSTLIFTRTYGATETAGYQWAQSVRIYETGSAAYADTDDNGATDPIKHESNATLTEQANLAIGGEKTWTENSLSIELGAQLLHLERSAPSTAPPGTDRLDRQLNPHMTLSWRHDIDKHWSTNAQLGAIYVIPYGTDPFNPSDMTRIAELLPVGSVTGAYTNDWGRALISVGRAVTANQFIAQNTRNDSAQVSFSLPIRLPDDNGREPRLVAASTLGYARTTLLDPVFGQSQGSFDIIHADAGFAWAPKPNMQYGVRYEFVKQIGEKSNDPTVAFFDFSRSTLFLTFSLRWPEQVAAQVPRSLQSQRADKSDLQPAGAEVVVPEEPVEDDK